MTGKINECHFDFRPGQRVWIGDDNEIKGVIDRASWCRDGVRLYTVDWMHGGSVHSGQFYSDDLRLADGEG